MKYVPFKSNVVTSHDNSTKIGFSLHVDSEDEAYENCNTRFISGSVEPDEEPVTTNHVEPVSVPVYLRKPSNNCKPHKSNDMGWEAIQSMRARDGVVELSHFKLLRRLGCGDIGSMYLREF